ncbi:MAG: tRNA (adenosine(37)-N6)-threonylcarbamoyltransferase complex transferase subunit TsaD [Leptospiraceae bacterium]|nr:tRNA (adenosine(37)-N6)-threonylcarbamoyltransferase complex transferase subunit TsaD [Leptospiraceae bacterium]MDW8307084.1 tRNA (adenosine(37)-N6)-threonylcarbamoyltransferase complex transferase subunit TsaD [Leptospiraceae bacterium]
MEIIGLGIETSCDETAVALVANGMRLLANPIFRQVAIHEPYGGVIPEKASRAHLEKLPYLLQDAFSQKEAQKISYVAVTHRPGLTGSLLVGYNTALALSWYLGIDIITINHLEAHLYAPLLSGQKPSYPFLGLLLSGGNTALYYVKDLGQLSVIADTQDDACGEALDKAASLLGLPYPGGPQMEKKALSFMEKNKTAMGEEEHLCRQNPLSEILVKSKKKPIFSFSGLKTSLYYYLQKNPNPDIEALAYFFLQRVTEHVLRVVDYYTQIYPLGTLVFAGGVAANSYLRYHLQKLCKLKKIELIVPPPAFCTDNAAMVAALGYLYYQRGLKPSSSRVFPDSGLSEPEGIYVAKEVSSA